MTGTRLPNGEALTAPLIESDFRRFVAELPAVLGSRSFSLVLPAYWQAFRIASLATVPEPGGSAVLLAQFNGPEMDGFTAFAQVQCAQLDREISAANWLRFYCEQMQYVPRQIDTISSHLADALVGFQIAGRVVAARVAVRLFGPSLYIVLVGVAAQEYDQYQEILGLAVRSFALADQKPGGQVEHWQTVAAAIGPRLAVPQSWTAEAIPGPDKLRGAFDLTNRNAGQVWLGQIRLRWLDYSVAGSDAEEAKKMIGEFGVAGVQMGRLIAGSTDPAATEAFGLKAECVREATVAGNKKAFEFWRLVLCDQSYRILIAMLTPSRNESLFWWAVNRRALEIVASTLQ